MCPCVRVRIDEFGFPVTSARDLASDYLRRRRGWIPLACMMPLGLVPLVLAMTTFTGENGGSESAGWLNVNGCTINGGHDPPTLLLFFAILRMARMVPAFKCVTEFLDFNFRPLSIAVQRLVKAIVCTLYLIHFSACLFWTVSILSKSKRGWVWQEGLVVDDEGVPVPWVQQYLKSFYAAQLALFFHDRTLYTDLERAYAIVEILAAAIVFGTLFGVIIALIKGKVKSVASRQMQEERTLFENVKRYMTTKELPPSLQEEIMRHKRYKARQASKEDRLILAGLPENLTQSVCEGLYLGLVCRVEIFQDMDLDFQKLVARQMFRIILPPKTTVLSEGEERNDIYIIQRGSVEKTVKRGKGRKASVLCRCGPNEFFGDIAAGVQYINVTTVEETELCILQKAQLTRFMSSHPTFKHLYTRLADERRRAFFEFLATINTPQPDPDHTTRSFGGRSAIMKLVKASSEAFRRGSLPFDGSGAIRRGSASVESSVRGASSLLGGKA
ncbi:hypothetical protein HK101_004460, partial [Irineochytrium annulatum]